MSNYMTLFGVVFELNDGKHIMRMTSDNENTVRTHTSWFPGFVAIHKVWKLAPGEAGEEEYRKEEEAVQNDNPTRIASQVHPENPNLILHDPINQQ